MGHLALDSLLSPDRVVVVGADDASPTGTASETEPVTPSAVADDPSATLVDDTDLAIVETAVDVERTVPALIDAGVGAILVTAAVERRTWFDLVAAATDAGVHLLGPEASIAVPRTGLGAGIDETFDAGTIGVVTEDGMTLSALAAEAATRHLGFSVALATGHHSTVRPADVLRALEDDEETTVVLTRPEQIDRDFFDAASTLSPEMALAVHAPKWASADEPLPLSDDATVAPDILRDAVLRQAGVLAVDSVDRLLDLAPALAEQPLPADDNVVIVSNAGGPGVMATDAVGTSRLSMADLADETVEALEAVIPERAYARNPLDLLADSDIQVFRGVLDAVLTDPGVDAAVVISAPNPLFTFEELADIVVDARSEHESPVVTALMGGESTRAAADQLRQVGIPNYFDPFQAVAVIASLADQRDAAAKRRTRERADVSIPVDKVRTRIERDDTADEILEAAGLDVDGGGDGVAVSVAVRTLPTLGPVVAVGVSEYTGILDDVAVRVAPPSVGEVRAMLDELRASQLLKGARGTEAVDVTALVESIQRLSAMVASLDEVDDVSATLHATADGVTATAGRVVLATRE